MTLKMQINGISFKTYVSDSIESIRDRVAADMKTLPKFLLFQPSLDSIDNLDRDYRVDNILPRIRNLTSTKLPQSVLDAIASSASDTSDLLVDVKRIFIASNRTLEDLESTNATMVNAMLFSMEADFGDVDIEQVFGDREDILFRLDAEIQANVENVKENVKDAREFSILPPVKYTPYELSFIRFKVNLGPPTRSLNELFDAINLNQNVPFAMMGSTNVGKNIYKVYSYVRIDEKWTMITLPDTILCKVYVGGDREEAQDTGGAIKYSNYLNSVIKLTKTETLVYIDYKMGGVGGAGKPIIGREEYIRRCLSVFRNHDSTPMYTAAADIRSIEEDVNVAYFTVPNQCLDIPIYAELVMNDQIFYSSVVIDEFTRASKIKQNIYLHILKSDETCSLQAKHTISYNMYGMENIGEPYIRCRIQTRKNNHIPVIQDLIGKLFTIYNAKHDQVLNYYRRYIPTFQPDTSTGGCKPKIIKNKKLGLRNIAPDIFYPNYSRKCLYKPTIISDEEAKTTTLQVMKFPIKGESVQRNYVCDISHHPYPGLRENNLENKQLFPYVPCCYTKNQERRVGSQYRRYFYGEDVKEPDHHIQEVYTSTKILPLDVVGVLPKRVQDMFSILEPDPNFWFVRKGVSRTRWSSVEAVMTGLGMLAAVGENDLEDVLRSEVDRLATSAYAMSCKQELYNYSVDEIVEMIKHNDLRATSFIRLLETAYNCNIYVFVSDTSSDEGYMAVPRHLKAYYKFKPDRQSIFLYQHMGSESDNAEYPQCELIVKTRYDNIRYKISGFVPSDQIVVGVDGIFRNLTKSYIFSRAIEPLSIANFTVVHQLIDSFGKCRVINVNMIAASKLQSIHSRKPKQKTDGRDDTIIFTIVCDPLPPFAAASLVRVYRPKTKEAVVEFQRKFNLKLLWQRRVGDRIREIGIDFGAVGTLLVDIPVAHTSSSIEGVTVIGGDEEYARLLESDSNPINKFILARRLARLLYAYTVYRFSKYIENISDAIASTSSIKEDVYSKFIADTISIDPAIEYKISDSTNVNFQGVANLFTTNSGGSGRIMVKNRETLKRLMFMIRLLADTDLNKLLAYRSLTTIPNYYDDISDYDRIQNVFILQGKASLEDLIESYNSNYSITKSLQPELKSNYFYKSSSIGDGGGSRRREGAEQIYLASNRESFEDAYDTLMKWNRDRYTTPSSTLDESMQAPPQAPPPPTSVDRNLSLVNVYKYINDGNIELLNRGSMPGAILGYRIGGTARYTTLMKIG